MALSIENAETEELARRLASITGQSVTGAVTAALRRSLEEAGRSASPRERRLRELRRIAEDSAHRWPGALRATEHGDLLYDDRGLPR